MIKIALSGKGGVGKNTVASLIAQDTLHLQNNEYMIVAFAARIKQIIQNLFPGCDEDALYGASALRQNVITSDLDIPFNKDVTYRQVSCDIGKIGRSYNQLIWIAHMAHQLKTAPSNTKLFIVSDLRFLDEFTWAKNNNFIMCRIKRNEQLVLNDISETEQDELKDNQFDIIIDNNCPIEELGKLVTLVLDKHFSNNKAYLQARNAAI